MNTKNKFLLIILLFLISIMCLNNSFASEITINPMNNTLNSVINNYDTIYLADGIYNGSNNKNLNIHINTTIIGNNKNNVIIDTGSKGIIFKVDNGTSLTLINMTLKSTTTESLIVSNGSLDINNILIKDIFPNKEDYIIDSNGDLKISNSMFENNLGFDIRAHGYNKKIEIINSTFKNNPSNLMRLIYIHGDNLNITFNNLIFINNSAYGELILATLNNSNISITNSKFINSSCPPINIEVKSTFAPPPSLNVIDGLPNNVTLKNNTELNTVLGTSPHLSVSVDLDSYSFNGVYYHVKPNTININVHLGSWMGKQKVSLYVNNKLVSTKNTDLQGDTVFYYYPKTAGKFNIKVVFKGYTKKVYNLDGSLKSTSTFTGASKKTSFTTYGARIRYSQKSKFVYKNKYLVRTYMVKNIGKFVGSTTIHAILAKKYNFVYISKNIKISYYGNKKNRIIAASVKNLIPYAANKKSYCLVAIARKL